jgi:hypothetical protein
VLADQLGFPFANVGLPEGNSRNLHSILRAIIARSPSPPTAVVHVSGGDFTSFCYTAIADPVFGSPNLKQIQTVLKERGGRPPAQQQIAQLLAFTSLWIRAIAETCRVLKIPLLLADDTTFFEKRLPSAVELDSELGQPFSSAQHLQFETHKRFVLDYHTQRKKVADQLGVALAGPGRFNNIGFVDEFHYDQGGIRALCDNFAPALEDLLN